MARKSWSKLMSTRHPYTQTRSGSATQGRRRDFDSGRRSARRSYRKKCKSWKTDAGNWKGGSRSWPGATRTSRPNATFIGTRGIGCEMGCTRCRAAKNGLAVAHRVQSRGLREHRSHLRAIPSSLPTRLSPLSRRPRPNLNTTRLHSASLSPSLLPTRTRVPAHTARSSPRRGGGGRIRSLSCRRARTA